ncbi:unnamed protein product, partial [marine sediment metagenome]
MPSTEEAYEAGIRVCLRKKHLTDKDRCRIIESMMD